MKKHFGRNTIALGLGVLLVTTGFSFAANGAGKIAAQSSSSAVTATGLTQIVDTDSCDASAPDTAKAGDKSNGTGRCGTGLSTSGINAFDQTASTEIKGKNGTSAADASVAPINIPTLTTIDLSTATDDIEAINTGTILDDILDGLDPITKPLFQLLLTPVLTAIQDTVISPLTSSLQQAIPVSAEIGAVSAQCSATPTAATGESTVAAINLKIELPGDQTITVPVTEATSANSDLVAKAPEQLVDGLIQGLEDTLDQSLGGILSTLGDALGTVKTQILDQVFDAIRPVLEAASDGLAPLVTGTVNQQTKSNGKVDVQALHLEVGGGQAATLDTARVSCGPNSTVTATDTTGNTTGSTTNSTGDTTNSTGSTGDSTSTGNNANTTSSTPSADGGVTSTLPNTGAPNLWPFFLLGLALIATGAAALLNERRRNRLAL